MLNIFILLISVVTFALMTSDPRASQKSNQQSVWQKQKPSVEIHDLSIKSDKQSDDV